MALRALQLTNTDTVSIDNGDMCYIYGIWSPLDTAQRVHVQADVGGDGVLEGLVDTGVVAAPTVLNIIVPRAIGPCRSVKATVNGPANVWIYYDRG